MEEEAIEAKRSATRIAIVIPALNECEAVGKVVGGVQNAMAGYDFEYWLWMGAPPMAQMRLPETWVPMSFISGAKVTAML